VTPVKSVQKSPLDGIDTLTLLKVDVFKTVLLWLVTARPM
jgi:hypothetical protein